MPMRPLLLAAALLPALPAAAQRSGEDALRSAEDAFGATVGRESVGIYTPDDVRGFSAVIAGNVRIDGLYFDQQQAPTAHLLAGATMRVGLTAQGYAFPAPTGIVDYTLRKPGSDAVVSASARATGWGSYSLEADGQAPLTPHLAIGAGGGFYHDVFADRTWADTAQAAAIARWTPGPGIEIVPFAEWSPIIGNPAQPAYLTADGAPPAALPRRYRGPDWTLYRGTNLNLGTTGSIGLGKDATLRFGGFRSVGTSRSTFAHLLVGLDSAGTADRVIIADPPRRYASTSGDLRLAYGIAEGPRRHLLVATLRGRAVDSRYGGSALLDFGPVSIFAPARIAQPAYALGASTADHVGQWTAGASYTLSWQGRGSAIVGLQRTDYRKRVAVPGAPVATARDAPLLWNAAATLDVTPSLAVYGSATRGLEEAGAAPDVAINRNSLSSAVRTRQLDAGLRFHSGAGVTFTAGVFRLAKPYDAVDPANLFRRLGTLGNRGAEASLGAHPAPSLTLLAGIVLLDATVSGSEVASGRIARRPVGWTPYKAQLGAAWAPAASPWSFDLQLTTRGRLTATTDGRVRLPSRTTADLGARYRLALGPARAVLRVQVTNITDTGGYALLGPGAYKLADDRQAILSLTTDL